MTTYDAIVVGARCAGASTAMLLARAGARVLLVDRATFPSDIPHGHFIHRHGPERLARWGLLDRVLATGCPPVDTMTQDLDGVVLHGRDLAVDGIPFGLAPRRTALDRVLADAAVEAGAELRDGFAVLDYLIDDGRVTGIRGRHGRGGATVEERAAIVIGADGRNSGLARAVDAPFTTAAPTVACWYFTYFSGVETRGLEMYLRDERIVFAFPTNDGLLGVFIGWPIREMASVRGDLERRFMAAVDHIDGFGERVRAGRRAERFAGMAHLPNFLRRPHGPGWALVGDAGCHKDPFFALGICDAFRDADLLAEALTDAWSGAVAVEDALAGYEQRRDAATLPDYQMNLAAAHLQPPPPEVQAIRESVSGDAAATRAFLLTMAGRMEPVAAG